MKTRSDVTGFKELHDLLAQLPDRVQKRVLQKGTNAAARVFLSAYKSAIPHGDKSTRRKLKDGTVVDYGRWYQNMKTRVMRRLRNRTAKGSQVYTGNAFWAAFYEYGTRHQPARPILRAAAEAVKDKAALAMRSIILKGIEDEAKKLTKD